MNDLLTDRLHEATEDLAARLRSGSALRAAATRRRQRQRVLAGAVAAVALATVATTVQVENDADRLVPTVDRSSSPAPSTSPTSEPAPGPSSAPSPTGSGVPSPSPSATGGNPLAGFHFQEEKTWVAIPPDITVTLSRDPLTAWVLDPCVPTTYPTDRQRIAMISLERVGQEAADVRQIAVYPNAAIAAEVMDGFRRVLSACATRINPAGTGSTSVTASLAIADEGLVVAQSSYQDGRQFPGGGYHVVVRDGRSVYLAEVGGEFQPTGTTDRPATDLIAVAQASLPLPQ